MSVIYRIGRAPHAEFAVAITLASTFLYACLFADAVPNNIIAYTMLIITPIVAMHIGYVHFTQNGFGTPIPSIIFGVLLNPLGAVLGAALAGQIN